MSGVKQAMELKELRKDYHQNICENIMYLDTQGVPNIADKHSRTSCAIAERVVGQLECETTLVGPLPGQTTGERFEVANREFLQAAFHLISHLRPGRWNFDVRGDISQFQQYGHLADLEEVLNKNPELKTTLGSDYLITPDVIVARYPVSDQEINQFGSVIYTNEEIATHTPLRESNYHEDLLILHASISVKWTLRSDRAQNARTEALNLIRNRKGHTPKIVAVTAEPLPGRIASLALGTGDVDCVYHFALPELVKAVNEVASDDSIELLETLIDGDRLRDISDLPFDLAI